MRRLYLFGPIIALAACGSPQDEASAPQPPAETPMPVKPRLSAETVAAAKAALLAEPKVRDLVYEPDEVVQWKLGVPDDGTDRFGLSQTFCMLLDEKKARVPGTKIRLISWQRITRDRMFDAGSELVTIDCDTTSRWPS